MERDAAAGAILFEDRRRKEVQEDLHRRDRGSSCHSGVQQPLRARPRVFLQEQLVQLAWGTPGGRGKQVPTEYREARVSQWNPALSSQEAVQDTRSPRMPLTPPGVDSAEVLPSHYAWTPGVSKAPIFLEG